MTSSSGGRRYWLLKSEPDPHVKMGVDLSYSFERLSTEENETGIYCGVRNFQARNFLRDQMHAGDLCFFYHSSCKVPGIAGIVEVAKDPFPDTDATITGHPMFDSKHTTLSPRWYSVAIKRVRSMSPFVTLTTLKENEERLRAMALLRQPRLSVQPVTKEEWDAILEIETGYGSSASKSSNSSSSSAAAASIIPPGASHLSGKKERRPEGPEEETRKSKKKETEKNSSSR